MSTSIQFSKSDTFAFTGTKVSTILWATLVAGILDAIAAIALYYGFYNFNPVQIYQFVASGLLGTDAYTKPVFALLGVFVHISVALGATLSFFYAYPKINFLARHKVFSGLLFGAAIWGFMNLVIIPLSKIPPQTIDHVAFISLLCHLLLVGLPISLIINSHYQSGKK